MKKIVSCTQNKKMKAIIENYSFFKEQKIQNRLINFSQMMEILDAYSYTKIGQSVDGKSINALRFGTGEKKVAIWTQMHGNESTGTNAVFDLLKVLTNDNNFSRKILQKLSLLIIPMVNPDGTELYQRRNAMHIDINRDFVKRQAPETQILQQAIRDFQPEVCFNLHDQRTIFNVSGTSNPATISFLAPSEDVERTITQTRKETMGIIAKMNTILQEYAPQHVGRYTDEFYPSAFGDNLAKEGYRTILIEGGGSKNDLERQNTRFYNWVALLAGLAFIADSTAYEEGFERYFDIPENDQKMLDIIYRNVMIEKNGVQSVVDLGIMLNESLSKTERKLIKNPKIEQIGDLDYYFGYEEIEAQGKKFQKEDRNYPILNESADFELV